VGLLWHLNSWRLRLLLSWSHTFFILLHNFARIHEFRAITTNARVLLQLLEKLLALLTFIWIPSLPIAVFSVTTLTSLATATTALFSILLAAPLLAPVVVLAFRALIVSLGLLLILVILILLLLAFLFGIELGCFLVTIADKDLLRFLKIYDSFATFKGAGPVDHIVDKQFDSLFFILDCEQDAMLFNLLTWVVSLTLEVHNVVIKKGAGYVLVEFCIAESPQS
jgi:hypothetical protein